MKSEHIFFILFGIGIVIIIFKAIEMKKKKKIRPQEDSKGKGKGKKPKPNKPNKPTKPVKPSKPAKPEPEPIPPVVEPKPVDPVEVIIPEPEVPNPVPEPEIIEPEPEKPIEIEKEEPGPPVVPIEPTEESPLIYDIFSDVEVRLKWLPVEDATKYLVQILPDGQKGFVTRGRDVTTNSYGDQKSQPGDKAHYRVIAYTPSGKITVGTILTEVPEEDLEVMGASEFPDEIPENTEYFRITVDLESDQDQTAFIQKQIDAVPNGTKEKYNALEFYSPDGNILTEGDLANNPFGWKGAINLIGRRYLIVKGVGENKVRFYSKEPAVPLGGSINGGTYSRRTLFKVRNSVNIWFYNIIAEGGNTYKGDTIGSTPELTPHWWYLPYKPALPENIKGFEALTASQKWYALYREGTSVSDWYLKEREEELLAGREVPEEIVNETNKGKKDAYYKAFLGQNITDGEMVPRTPDSGATRTSMVWQKELEQEHGVDARHCKMLKFTKCEFRYLFGDGIYADETQGIIIDEETISENVGRQNYGFSSGVSGLRMKYYKAINNRRAGLDFEPMNGRTMSDLEVAYGVIDGHIAAGGHGAINDVSIHHNKINSITMKGSADEPRRNWSIEDNQYIGGNGSPIAVARFSDCENVKVNRNHFFIPTNQGRQAFELKDCSGKIEVKGNTYEYPSIIRLLNCKEGTEVILDEDAPDNVYVIQIEGQEQKVIGTNPDLLEKLGM